MTLHRELLHMKDFTHEGNYLVIFIWAGYLLGENFYIVFNDLSWEGMITYVVYITYKWLLKCLVCT